MTEVKTELEKAEVKPAEQGPSIVVLPFANMTGDKEQEYFSDGLAEEIIHTLAHLPGLKVTARTSAFSRSEARSKTSPRSPANSSPHHS
jgi:TolB-like protein